ncbi:MAG: XrtA/PEP-CTERM system-associated ATPase [Parvularculaceae bacterium]|nr:XrtA/PEP-CTERM system-associated ATPase [Parvularculaceae bacterium]
MFEEHFSFSGSPFRLAPDPKFFFGSKSHNKAMSYLHYGLRQAEGFIVITGEIGAGKTMLIGHLLDQLDRSNVIAANLLTPNLQAADLLSHILSAFRIEAAGEGKASEIEAFEDFLFDQLNHGRRVLLVVDEAQNLPLKTLEELRVLSNMEYDGTPLFQVFLVGQPDFRETMGRADMEQLRQRVIATYHLEPMTREETEGYIRHRLAQVGWTGKPEITGQAFDAIFAAAGGLPRKIHKLCNRVLLFAAVENVNRIDGAAIEAVLADLIAEQTAAPSLEASEDLKPAPVKRAEPEPDAAAPGIAPEGSDTVETQEGPNDAAVTMPAPAPAPTPTPTPTTASVTGPASPAGDSVFDRLRAGRNKSSRAAPASEAKPATLDDVASAIAAARIVQRDQQTANIRERAAQADVIAPSNDVPPPPRLYGSDAVNAGPLTEIDVSDFNGDVENGDSDDHPSFAEDPSAWREAVAVSITSTRDELKRAHQSVAKLRRQLTEIDSRRRRRREQIEASLGRAETLLTEIRNAWR